MTTTDIRERETTEPDVIPEPCGCDLRCNHHHRPDIAFYVTTRRDTRTAWLLGPFTNHADALAHVDTGRRLAIASDRWSHFDSFGTASIPAELSARLTPAFTPDGARNPHPGYQKPSGLVR